jgi:hypothetical protein
MEGLQDDAIRIMSVETVKSSDSTGRHLFTTLHVEGFVWALRAQWADLKVGPSVLDSPRS